MNHSPDEWEEDQHLPQHPSTVVSPTWPKRLKKMFTRHWQPKALPAPVVDTELPHLNGIERAAEVIRFILTTLEHWLSPSGRLREFIKMNARLAIAIAVPVIIVAPLVTLALEQLKAWVALLTTTMSSFVLFPLSVLLCVLLVSGMVFIGRSILAMRMRSSRPDSYNY